MNLSVYFAELQPMTREFYGFDSFRSYRATEETEKERLLALNRYLMKTLKLHQALTFLLTLKKSPSILKQPVQKFDACCQCYDIPYLYSLLTGDMEKEIGYALSFIASLDIYNHSSAEKSNLFITSYQIGTRKLNAKIIDRVITYLMDTFHTNPKIKQ